IRGWTHAAIIQANAVALTHVTHPTVRLTRVRTTAESLTCVEARRTRAKRDADARVATMHVVAAVGGAVTVSEPRRSATWKGRGGGGGRAWGGGGGRQKPAAGGL